MKKCVISYLKILALSMLSLTVFAGEKNQAANNNSETVNYKLIWSDEFDTDGKPGSQWDYENGFVRNRELQWYQSQDAAVSDGCLIITGRKEAVKNPDYLSNSNDWRKKREYSEYTSACLTTRKSFTFKYGRVEVRARIPVASGSWPAIWLLGNKWGWPDCGEIDMMEFYRRSEPIILANACWGGKTNNPSWDESTTPLNEFTSGNPGWSSCFHLWRMDWDKEFIRLYLDDRLLNEIDLSKTTNGGSRGNIENPFSNDIKDFGFYILLNLAIGSNGGTPDENAFPMKYEIDYVRVYQSGKL